MPLAAEQARGCVQSDPAGARQIHLGPGVQVGEVGGRAFRTLQRLHVGDELDQVARHEARGHAQMAQHLHQQPGGIAAGAFAAVQGFFRGEHPRFQADDVGDLALDQAVQRDQLIDRALFVARDRRQQCGQVRAGGFGLAERGQLLLQNGVIGERAGLGLRLQEEVERVDRHHVGDQIDRHLEPVHFLGEHHAGEVVALRVLHPVDEMRLRFDRQFIGQDGGAGLRGRAQADGLRPERDRVIVVVGRLVGQGDVQWH
ncbi:hypothetical protein GALL_523080 [mine drainage metagenome]|uniref:Uncharacterized protein n=1 Tax=mine drainage metagenome TaxID=410659 RepID=A0A1J5P4N0_9ZZZZ